MQVAVYTNKSGGVTVLTPSLETTAYNPSTGQWYPLKGNEPLPEGFRHPTIEEVATKDAPVNEFIIIDDATLPDRGKREAWVIENGQVVIDERRVSVDYIQIIRDMVQGMNPAVLMRYPGHVGLIGQFLDASNTAEAIGLIQVLDGIIQDNNDTEAKVEIDKVLQLLQQAGLIQ